jgi:hypothetical protein
LPVRGGGGFFSLGQQAQLQGEHSRKYSREVGKIYVAGIDLAGEAEEDTAESVRSAVSGYDSTVVTIGELDFSACDGIMRQPVIKVVTHYRWTGIKHTELYGRLVDIIRNVWRCRRVAVDATGIGQPVCSFLKGALGSVIVPFGFTRQSKSELGFSLLAAVDSGRLKMYKGDGSAEYSDFWHEVGKARSRYYPGRTVNFSVAPSQGQDAFLMSLALLVEASVRYRPREARGIIGL